MFLGTVAIGSSIVVGIWLVGNELLEQQRQETAKKMAEQDAEFIKTLTQRAGVVEFLPIGEIKGLKIPGAESEVDLASDTTEILFEPSPEEVLSYLLGHYLNIFIYRALLEAKASEQSARMVGMKNATDSATGLANDLTLEYNKLRQGNITKELLEIAGGQLGNE